MRAMTGEDRARFFVKIAMELAPGACWEWIAGRFAETEYGQFDLAGKKIGAHRVMFELEVGPIPAGALVCHSCDRPWCVRPDHLFLGSYADNARDRHRKGRTGGLAPRISARMARAIRAARRGGTRAVEIAASYQVSTRYVRMIATGAAHGAG